MPEPLTIRCSALPLASACPASQLADGVRVDSADESAALGSAVHQVLAEWIRDRGERPIEEVAEYWGADQDEVAQLASLGRLCWRQLRDHFPAPAVEAELQQAINGVLLTGHIDLHSIVGDELRILDWKTGREDADHDAQLRGYGWLGLNAIGDGGLRAAHVLTVRVRDQVVDGARYTREELAAWWDGLVDQLRGGRYNPGVPQCLHCPRRLSCAARRDLIQQAAALSEGKLAIGPNNAGQVYDRVRLLDAACAEARDALRFLVAEAGGALHLGDGRQLQITQQKHREIEARLALPVLREFMSPDEVDGCLKVSNTLAEAATKANAGYRKKGAAVKELWTALDQAGAVHLKTVERMEIKKHVSTDATEIATDDPRFQPVID